MLIVARRDAWFGGFFFFSFLLVRENAIYCIEKCLISCSKEVAYGPSNWFSSTVFSDC